MKKYKLIIQTETDYDYNLVFPFIRFPHKIEFDGNYKVEIEFNNNVSFRKDIIEFLEGLNLISHKDYIENAFKTKMKLYLKELKKGNLVSSNEFLGGNNSFIILIFEITEQYL